MIATASHSSSTISIWWVEKMRVVPRLRISPKASLRSETLTGSRPTNGSSMIRTSGSWRIAAMSWTFCWLPFESSSARRFSYSGIRKRASQSRPRAGRLLARDRVERGEEDELLQDLEAGIEAALLGEVAPGLPRHLRRWRAGPGHRAAVGPEDVQDDPHRRGLAGPVRTEEPEDLAALDAERDAVQGGDRAEVLREVVEDKAHAPVTVRMRRNPCTGRRSPPRPACPHLRGRPAPSRPASSRPLTKWL